MSPPQTPPSSRIPATTSLLPSFLFSSLTLTIFLISMSPPQQILPSSSSAQASPPVTTASSFSMPVVPTPPSPVTETVTTAPSGSVSTEAPVIEAEQKLTPITATPAPVTASPVPEGSDFSTVVLTMAVDVNKMRWLNTLMYVAVTLSVHLLDSLPKATSPKIMDTTAFYMCYSRLCFISSYFTIVCLKIGLLLCIDQSNLVFHYIMMHWAVTFLFGFYFLFAAYFLMSIAAA